MKLKPPKLFNKISNYLFGFPEDTSKYLKSEIREFYSEEQIKSNLKLLTLEDISKKTIKTAITCLQAFITYESIKHQNFSPITLGLQGTLEILRPKIDKSLSEYHTFIKKSISKYKKSEDHNHCSLDEIMEGYDYQKERELYKLDEEE
jgi:hypothetical protein